MRSKVSMATNLIDEVKRLVIISMFSDDELMDVLVLKGGNALDLIYGISPRASVDIDFSIESEFQEDELEKIQMKIQEALSVTFGEKDLVVFDVKMKQKPRTISRNLADFWGGYEIEFKIIEKEKHDSLSTNLEKLRRNALMVGGGKSRIKIDISKYEFCRDKEEKDLDGYTIYVYSPEMLVIEKLRATCQQTKEYCKIVKTHKPIARARDFFDIAVTVEHFSIDLSTHDNLRLLEAVFAAKKVPLSFLGLIRNYRELHRSDFAAVLDTVKPGEDIQDFDFYFDYVVGIVEELRSLWDE